MNTSQIRPAVLRRFAARPVIARSLVTHHLPQAVFLFFLVFYLMTARGYIRGLDETVMFTTMQNLWDRHTLVIDELIPLDQAVVIGDYGNGGHLYSKLPAGSMLFAIWLYGIGQAVAPGLGMVLASFTNSFLSAAGMLIFFLFLRKSFPLSTSLITTISFGVCTDWWYQTRGFGSETGAGVFLLAALFAAQVCRPYQSAAAFGLSLWFRPVNLIALPVWLLNLKRSGKAGLLSSAVLLFFLLGLMIYNFIRFSNPVNFGYGTEDFSLNPFSGLVYVFFSPGRSVFLYSPVLLLAIQGAVLWYRRDKALAASIVTTVALYAFTIAAWDSWHGGWSWGSRLLTPVLPMIGLLTAPAIEFLIKKRGTMTILAVLSLIGFVIGCLALLQDPLLTYQNHIASGEIPFEETLFTIKHSLLALQVRDVILSPQIADSVFIKVIVQMIGLL